MSIDRPTAQRLLAQTRDEKIMLKVTVNDSVFSKVFSRVEGSLLNNRLALRGTVAFTNSELEKSEELFKSGQAAILDHDFTLDRRSVKLAEKPYVYALTYYLDIET